MLHDFISANRERIIERARRRVRERVPRAVASRFENGIPLFLTQLADAMAAIASTTALHLVTEAESRQKISDSAAIYGRDLLRNGFSVAQVVHGYGDVCQIVTALATELGEPISAQEFHLFNRCLDDAIAGAVTSYASQRERDLAYEGTERLGVMAHELRNLLNTAILSFDVIKKGTVGLGGRTAAVHSRSLAQIHALVEHSLAEVRLGAGTPAFERVSVFEFIAEIVIVATLEAEGYGVRLTVESVDEDIGIEIDRQLLASAVTNLLQNAFKYTRPHGRVTLATRVSGDSVLIEVSDECGGLPAGKAEDLFGPFTRRSSDRSGLGLGLMIAMRAVRANSGDLYVRDFPGTGCVFTIQLPRKTLPPAAISSAQPESGEGSDEGSERRRQAR